MLAAKGPWRPGRRRGTRVRAQSGWSLLDPDVLAWRIEARPDGNFLRNVVEFRRIIEPEAVRLAAERATDAEVAALEEVSRQIEEAIDDPEAHLEPDLRFHELILQACHNDLPLTW